MDSWKYVSEGKSVWFSDEVDFSVDDHNCKRKLVGCEIKPIHNVENYPLISNTQALERMDFMDLGFPDDIRKSYSISSEQSGEVFSDEIGTDYHPLFGEERESGSRICTEFMQSNKQDFSLVDLKLGSLADGGIGKGSELPKADVRESSIMLSSPAKKARPTLLSMRSHYCQVHGCSKDLSSCKSYYKRHKVCDVHTKTPKVIVDGIEQRFCQQCSRFHLLAEFDDIKRSCRRRLAAHNKRRRRPQLSSESGSGIIDFSLSQTFPGVMPSVFLSPNKYEDRCEDSIKSSNFLLEMGRVEEKMDKIAANVKGDIFELVKPKFDDECSIQQTNRALSLLSAQSHSISSQWLETASTPLINQNNQHADAEAGKTISMEADEEGPTTMNGDPVGLQLNPKGPGIILNLLQLSSHLQRLEHQRHSTQNEAG